MKLRTLYVVKKGDVVLLETFDLREATTLANKSGSHVEWVAVY